MRYYDLTITTPSSPSRVVKQWTSHPNGIYDSGAQNIEFDMIVLPYETPSGGQIVRIYGISLNDLQMAQEFTGLNISLKAGMKKSLPLANPLQSGLIAQGLIFQSFGNWEGTEMTLDFVIYPADTTGNITINWTAGQKLADALKISFANAYPNIQPKINISDTLVLSHDEVGYYSSFTEMAQTLSGITAAQGHPVFMVYQGDTITVFDDTYSPNPIQLNFVDLVGQPTWISVNTMQLKVILRADISVGSKIKMPIGMGSVPGLVSTRADSLPSGLKYKTSFQGLFLVTELRQLGNFRTNDGASWVTIINCTVSNG